MLLISPSDNTGCVIVGRIEDTVYQSPGRRKHRRLGKGNSTAEGRKKRERRGRLAVESAFRTKCFERLKLAFGWRG